MAMCVRLCECIYMCMCVLYMNVCVRLFECSCVCVRVHACECVCVYVWWYLHESFLLQVSGNIICDDRRNTIHVYMSLQTIYAYR